MKVFWLVLFENTRYDPENYFLQHLETSVRSVDNVSNYKGSQGADIYQLYRIKIK